MNYLSNTLHTVYRYFILEPSEPIISNEFNPRIYDHALTILNLSIQESQDFDLVELRYIQIINIHTEKQKHLPPLLASELERWKQEATTAYQTIIQHGPHKKFT